MPLIMLALMEMYLKTFMKACPMTLLSIWMERTTSIFMVMAQSLCQLIRTKILSMT